MNRWAPMQHQFGPPKSVLGAFAPRRAELGWPPADSHPSPLGTVVLRLDPLPTGGGGSCALALGTLNRPPYRPHP